MNKIISFLLLLVLNTTVAFAQGSVKGRVLDKKSNTGLEFINVVIRKEGSDKILKGAITDTEGHFIISDVPNGNYTLTASGMGYKDVVRTFSLTATSPNKNFIALYLSEDAKSLDEVVVTAQRADMKLEVDRKTFSVDQQISNAGGVATDVLENIPSVEVDNEGNVSLRGNSSVEIWINGKSSGLTSDNRTTVWQRSGGCQHTWRSQHVVQHQLQQFSCRRLRQCRLSSSQERRRLLERAEQHQHKHLPTIQSRQQRTRQQPFHTGRHNIARHKERRHLAQQYVHARQP